MQHQQREIIAKKVGTGASQVHCLPVALAMELRSLDPVQSVILTEDSDEMTRKKMKLDKDCGDS